jgi:hypothetical protein
LRGSATISLNDNFVRKLRPVRRCDSAGDSDLRVGARQPKKQRGKKQKSFHLPFLIKPNPQYRDFGAAWSIGASARCKNSLYRGMIPNRGTLTSVLPPLKECEKD